ncbi:hypothetical protein AB0L53_26205 [Nonomuraea sp. NPDC052129]|uniref:hypothetical protein n=1 Tax=Nonomuraea sp. NPDC052129 TaxID=3154651 RepID=UPI0034388B69
MPDGDLDFFFKMLWDAAYNHREMEPYDVLTVTMDEFLDEDHLVQADYDVEVTDPRWLAALVPGHSRGTPVYSSAAD